MAVKKKDLVKPSKFCTGSLIDFALQCCCWEKWAGH